MEAKDVTRALILGISAGILGGVVLGSLLGLGVLPQVIDAVRRVLPQRQPRPRFDLYLQ